MTIPYELRIGWRYTRSARTAARNGFISFISGVSMLGIALGVAALIIVLSVMNGFQKEVRDRMLSVLAHVEVFDGVDTSLRSVLAFAPGAPAELGAGLDRLGAAVAEARQAMPVLKRNTAQTPVYDQDYALATG